MAVDNSVWLILVKKHWQCNGTLKDVGSPLGGDTAGDEGGGGGEEGEGERCEGGSWRRRAQSLSASDLVMRPHCAAEIGSTLASFRAASWAGVQVEQNICSSSQAYDGKISNIIQEI